MKLLKRIRALRSRLAHIASGLALAERRVAHYKARAKNAENPDNPHPKTLERADRRLHYWRAREHRAYLRRHHFKVALRHAVKKLRRKEPIVALTKAGLRVLGGDVEERLLAAMRFARKHWSDYYSEFGGYDEDFALNNHRHGGRRRDCSWWWYELRRACGLATRDVEPRYTKTIAEGREVSRAYAESHAGIGIVYFNDATGESFHVGNTLGHGPFALGHGTPSINVEHFDGFGPGTTPRFFD